ncbi:hypothetical protein BDK88_1735 [Natrinema hispanicum]|uniref:Uncharacterized protein n=1 Tax=Natrinema hispanicum TaxID=392421 RepID=A0A482Y7P8_9EURY|nr:hypothetical protein BDK88_1735 [Natrinema hispanicum]
MTGRTDLSRSAVSHGVGPVSMREKPGDVIATAFALHHDMLFVVMVGYKSLPDVALMHIIWIYMA